MDWHGWPWLVVQELYGQTSFWTLSFALPLDPRFLSGLQAFSCPLVLILSLGPTGKPKNFSATCWSLWVFPQISSSAVTTSALRPWWIEHFIKIKASLRGSYYLPTPPSIPHPGKWDTSSSGFWILQSGCLFFRFSSSGGKQSLHLPSFCLFSSFCPFLQASECLFLPVWWELSLLFAALWLVLWLTGTSPTPPPALKCYRA